MFFKLLKAKKNIPSIIFPFACIHLLKVKRCIPEKSIKEIIEDEGLKIIYEKMQIKGKYESKIIFVSQECKDNEKEILLHELFHYFEEKEDIKTSRLISEAAARLYTRIS